MKRALILVAVILLSGCGEFGYFNSGSPPTQEYSFPLDGVKLIAPDIVRTKDPNCFVQLTYDISPTRRLLIRFQSFADHVSKIYINNEDKRVKLLIAVNNLDTKELAEKEFKVCPITKDWMMFATWKFAHPYTGGSWTTPGGDYDTQACLTAQIPEEQAEDTEGTEEADETSPKEDNSIPIDEHFITFDVTDWFRNHVQGRSQNFGVILISGSKIQIIGDKSSHLSPRLIFSKII